MIASPSISVLTVSDIDRLASIARRQPHVAPTVAWTSVWVFLVFAGAFFVKGWFSVDGIVLLERVGGYIVLMAFLAGFLCWLWAKWEARRVERAQMTLASISKEALKDNLV